MPCPVTGFPATIVANGKLLIFSGLRGAIVLVTAGRPDRGAESCGNCPIFAPGAAIVEQPIGDPDGGSTVGSRKKNRLIDCAAVLR